MSDTPSISYAAQRALELTQVAELAAQRVLAEAASAARVLSESTAQVATHAVDTMKQTLEYIQKDLNEIKVRLDNKYVTREAFEPIQRIVYGLVGLILMGFVGGVLGLILRSKGI